MSRPRRGRGDSTERPGWNGAVAGEGDGADPGSLPGFICTHCGSFVPEMALGTGQRNHCPHCLWSIHVDIKPGDRRSLCASEMEPVAIWVADSGEWRLIHRCTGCGVLKPNRTAGDDSDSAIDALAGRLERSRPERRTDGSNRDG